MMTFFSLSRSSLLRSVENSKNISTNEHHRYHCEYQRLHVHLRVSTQTSLIHIRLNVNKRRKKKLEKSIRSLVEGEIKRM